jgi:hypothetical protein
VPFACPYRVESVAAIAGALDLEAELAHWS